MMSDNSSALNGAGMDSRHGFLTNQSMYTLGTNPDLDFSNSQIDMYNVYGEDAGGPSKYQLAKDTSWSFAQESFDKSHESSFGG